MAQKRHRDGGSSCRFPRPIYTAGGGLGRVPKALKQQEKSRKILGESGERPLLREEEAAPAGGAQGTPRPWPKQRQPELGGGVRSRCRRAPSSAEERGARPVSSPPAGAAASRRSKAAATPLLAPAQPRLSPGGIGEAEQGSQSPRQKQQEPLPGLPRAAALKPKEKERLCLRILTANIFLF